MHVAGACSWYFNFQWPENPQFLCRLIVPYVGSLRWDEKNRCIICKCLTLKVCWSQIWTSISRLFCLAWETLLLYFYNLHLWKLVFKIMFMNVTICLGLTVPWLVDFICEPPRSHTFSPNSFISPPQLDHGSLGANSSLCLALCLHSFFFFMDSPN